MRWGRKREEGSKDRPDFTVCILIYDLLPVPTVVVDSAPSSALYIVCLPSCDET